MFESLFYLKLFIFSLLFGRFRNIPRRMISSISQHGTDYVDYRRNVCRYGIKQKWYINPSPQNSVENGKGCFEVVVFGNDIIHPIWNGKVDVANLCSSVKQKLSIFMAIVEDGRSKSSTCIIIHEVKLSAGSNEDLS